MVRVDGLQVLGAYVHDSIYGRCLAEMGYFQDTFQNILSSVSFSPTSGGIGSSKNIPPIPTNQIPAENTTTAIP